MAYEKRTHKDARRKRRVEHFSHAGSCVILIAIAKADQTKTNMIHFENVSKMYPEDFVALRDVNLVIEPGEFVSLVGASGAGKSTLLKLLYAEEVPTSGRVVFFGRSTDSIKRRLLPYYRRNFGTVFQDFKLFDNRTVFENVAFALEVDGRSNAEIDEEVPKMLSVVGLEGKESHYPHQLSGGEEQRVSLARALIIDPKVLIADEPTGNLDPDSTMGIVELLLKIHEFGTTVILATHNKEVVDRVRKRVIVLDRGRVMRDEKEAGYN